MRLGFMAAALAVTAASIAAPASTFTLENGSDTAGLDYFPKQRRGKGKNNRRGKGKLCPPKSRSNRLTVSKRIRRKHRRAAK